MKIEKRNEGFKIQKSLFYQNKATSICLNGKGFEHVKRIVMGMISDSCVKKIRLEGKNPSCISYRFSTKINRS